MKWWEIVLCIIGISFCHYGYIKSYNLLFDSKEKNISIKVSILFLFITVITYYNTFYNYYFSKIIISFFELFVLFKLIYQERIKETTFKTFILYLIGWIIEMFLGLIMVYFEYNSLIQIDDNIIFKVLFSILMMLLMLLLSKIKVIKKLMQKLYFLMFKIFNIWLLIIISIFVLILLSYYLIIANEIYSIVSIVALVVILFLLIFIGIYQSIKTKKANDKQEILLNFMKEYEMIIDKERIDRHEMVNNLLVLKGIKNKNSKNYDKVLNDILLTYQSSKTPSGLYELPSGLKGLFYYKIYDMRNNNIETFINISNKILKDLDNLDSKILTKVCKILGILLDNAKEAAKESNKKLVVIDLYKEKNDTVVYIENSINRNNKLDLSKMKVKGFSTKGNNRGYGLYLVDRILNKTDKLELFQEINKNKFVSILKIKNN